MCIYEYKFLFYITISSIYYIYFMLIELTYITYLLYMNIPCIQQFRKCIFAAG